MLKTATGVLRALSALPTSINTSKVLGIRITHNHNHQIQPRQRHPISTSACLRYEQNKQYEGDGKTTITIMNTDADAPLMVDAYHQSGFKLNNGFAVRGPMALFPKTVLSWDVGSSDQITPESLALFTLLEPKLDILVIGIGDSGNSIPVETIQMLRKKKINFEILSTDHAVTTFNFLNAERRCIACAALPPRKISYREDDIIKAKKVKKLMYDPEQPD